MCLRMKDNAMLKFTWKVGCFTCFVVILLVLFEQVEPFPYAEPTVVQNSEDIPEASHDSRLSQAILQKGKHHDRRKRFDYVDNYDWESDEQALDYDETEIKELTLFQKIARNWKVVALRGIFLFSFLLFVLFCCQCVCRLVCPFCCDCCTTNCDQLTEWMALYLGCGPDPAYKKFNKIAQSFGIQMDYETFQKIKGNYGVEGNLMDSRVQQKAADNYN